MSIKHTGTFGWVQGKGQVWIPEKEFDNIPENHYPRAIHGYVFGLAVFNGDEKCVGWILAEKRFR